MKYRPQKHAFQITKRLLNTMFVQSLGARGTEMTMNQLLPQGMYTL